MSSDSDRAHDRLEESLERLGQALARSLPASAAAPAPAELRARVRTARRGGAAGLLGLSALFVTMAIVTGHFWLLVPASVFAIAAGMLLMRRLGDALLSNLPTGMVPRDPTRAHIGMGASIAEDAVVEPGASVEMGATVGAGAVIKRGAVVRMGATVSANAVLEEGAVVSWGATVMRDAVVGERASVGAGATVAKGAHVPAETSMMPGVTYTAGSESARPSTIASRAAGRESDPRDARVDAACDRLDAELRDAPEQVKAHLGASAETVNALRRTCRDLLRRERALRAEASPESLTRLDQEKDVLVQRLAGETDEVIRRSLTGAVAAIAEQKHQRELLRRSADRLEAEQTRLIWTLEGLGAQLVRLRTAGVEAGQGANEELVRGVQQLHDEIEAIAQALEQVADDDRQALAPYAEAPATFDDPSSPADRERERE